MSIDRSFLFAFLREHLFTSYTEPQVAGINHILDVWEAKYSAHPLSYLAYALATTYHETAKTMQPIEEYGRGAGHDYGLPAGPYRQVYDGRGFCMLTHYANYLKATTILQRMGILTPQEDLARTPDLAMRPDIAAAILFEGMIEGWFTGKKLADYIPHDPVNARRIINGVDRAQTIASYYTAFNASLRLSAAPVQIPIAQGTAGQTASSTATSTSWLSKLTGIFKRSA